MKPTMKASMSKTVDVRCPIDGEMIPVIIKLRQFHDIVILASDFNEAIVDLCSGPVLQEDLTRRLHVVFPSCRIKTIGIHQGVKITCVI